MAALIVTAKALVLLACVTVLPFWLIFGPLGVPVIYAVPGSVVLAIFLAALWMRPSA